MKDYYQEYFDLMEKLEENPRIIPSPVLYNFDINQIYAATMDSLSLPFEDGRESPFSSKSPGSAHSRLVESILHINELMAYTINQIPYYLWINYFRMLGLEISPSEYPVINMVFTRSELAAQLGNEVIIPLGTEVGSRINPLLSVYTTEEAVITGSDTSVIVPARLNQVGKMPEIRVGEFVNVANIPFLASVTNDGSYVSEGREKETLTEAMQRAIIEYRMGERCVTVTDFYNAAKFVAKSAKVNVFRGTQYGAPGIFDDLTTLVIYPSNMVQVVDDFIRPRSIKRERLDVRAAEIIPITGEISIRVTPSLNDSQAFNLAAEAIINKINPPYGQWGDKQFIGNLASALEEVPGIFAVPYLLLKNTDNILLEDINIQPWHLFEVQNSLTINILRR